MSLARAALTEFAAFVSAAVSPDAATLEEDTAGPDDPPPPSEGPIRIRPVALDRTSRSQRDGPVLDLELTVAVSSSGRRGLENTEALLTALESVGRYRVAPLDRQGLPAVPAVFSFLVRIPVAIRLDIPAGPPVREPLQLRMGTGYLLQGTVLGRDGKPLAGARVRAHASARTSTTGTDGRFELLTTHDDTQHFTVEFDGAARRISASSRDVPLTLRWEPPDDERGT
jgi:hypothetical protein